MKTYATLEDYAGHMRQETSALLGGLCSQLGPEHPITLRMADLCTEAATIENQSQMRQEQARGYDLAALVAVVDPTVPSNSEAGMWERED